MGWKYKSKAKSIKSALLEGSTKATRKTADEIAKGAKRRAHIGSGALKGSIYVADAGLGSRSGGRTTYPAAVSAAVAANPHVAAHIEPEVTGIGSSDGVARVAIGSAVPYAREVEQGGYSSSGYRAPAPFLAPSANEQENQHEARVADVIRKVETTKRL